MPDSAREPLLSALPEESDPHEAHATGVLPSQGIKQAIAHREIQAAEAILEDQIQPASLDLRLDSTAYRVRASFLPGKHATVEEKVQRSAMHAFDLTEGAVLEQGCVYIVPLMERVDFRKRTSALATPRARPAGSTCSRASSPITAPSSIASPSNIPARSMPRSRRAPSACSCARVRASCNCASSTARRPIAMPRSGACTRRSD